jgi:transmembrane sensor
MSETEKPTGMIADTSDPDANTEREALDWLRRLTSGKVTRADLDALDRWRAESPRHRQALAKANLLWDVLGKVAHEADARGFTHGGPVRAFLGHSTGRRAVLAGAAAASVAYLLVRPPLHLWPTVKELMAPYRTATGERRQLTVASGIEVEMDTQTSLTAPTTVGQLYSLELISGQLAVSVQAEADRSVIVAAAGGQTRADLGKFDVRRTGSSVCVTCADGVVHVSYRSMAATLQPGQQLTYDDHGLGSAIGTDPTVVTAWQRGLLIFRDVPLAEVVEEVNRYRSGRIILLNDTLAERKVIAGFRLDQIDDIVNYIGQAFGAKIRWLPGGVVLLS